MARWSLLTREASPAGNAVDIARVDDVDDVDHVLVAVDDALNAFAGRSFIARDEVLDRLLDVRNAVAAAALLGALDNASR